MSKSPDCSKCARAVEARRRELDPRHDLRVTLGAQQSFALGQGALWIPGHDQPFELRRAGAGTGLHRAWPAQEVVQRPAGALRNQLQGLHRGLGLSGFDEVDRGAADLVARDLPEAQTGFCPRLLDGARLDLDAAAAPTTARGRLPNLPRAVFS